MRDRQTGQRYLVDTDVPHHIISVISKQSNNRLVSEYKLYAANATQINTYGETVKTVDLGLRRSMHWNVIVADVPHATLAADFLSQSHLFHIYTVKYSSTKSLVWLPPVN